MISTDCEEGNVAKRAAGPYSLEPSLMHELCAGCQLWWAPNPIRTSS
jgi:hypothetical protein